MTESDHKLDDLQFGHFALGNSSQISKLEQWIRTAQFKEPGHKQKRKL